VAFSGRLLSLGFESKKMSSQYFLGLQLKRQHEEADSHFGHDREDWNGHSFQTHGGN